MGISLDPEEQRVLLGTHGEAVLATTSVNGAPVPLPVWYVVVDAELYIRTPAKAKRLRHIERNPTVAFLVHIGGPWRELRGVLITGRAEVVQEAGVVADVKHTLDERFAQQLPPPLPERVAARYDDSVILRIVPARDAVTWDNRKVRL